MASNWKRFSENIDDVRVERQLDPFGCGAACAVMLLADRGIAADQLIVSTRLHLPCTPQQLARRLNDFSAPAVTWDGGNLFRDPPFRKSYLADLDRRGSWAAQLIRLDQRDGHWVVVDGLRADDRVAVRDPAGSSYGMEATEFCELMRFMVAVFEVGEQP